VWASTPHHRRNVYLRHYSIRIFVHISTLLTLKTFSATPTHVMNICVKFYWIAFTYVQRFTSCKTGVNGRMDSRMDSIMPPPSTVGKGTKITTTLELCVLASHINPCRLHYSSQTASDVLAPGAPPRTRFEWKLTALFQSDPDSIFATLSCSFVPGFKAFHAMFLNESLRGRRERSLKVFAVIRRFTIC